MKKKNRTKWEKRIFFKFHSINRTKKKETRYRYSSKHIRRKSKRAQFMSEIKIENTDLTVKEAKKEVTSHKSKGDVKREKIFDVFKRHLNFLNDKGFVSTKRDVYLCPLDLKAHHHINENDPLTLEDAPPKSLGGKAHVLTCQSCNNKRGQDIDAELAKVIKEARLINIAFDRIKKGESIKDLKLPKSDHNVTFELDGKFIDGSLKFGEDGEMSVILPVKLSPGTMLNFAGSKVPKWGLYSLLKAAYILLFKKTGYTLLLNKCYDIVREQIENPDKDIYPENFCRIMSKDSVFTQDNKEIKQGVYFVQDKGIECMLVVFDITLGNWERKVLVLLPLPVRDLDNVLANFKEKMEKGKGQSLILYPQEQDREHAGDYLMKVDNLIAMYNWIEARKNEV